MKLNIDKIMKELNELEGDYPLAKLVDHVESASLTYVWYVKPYEALILRRDKAIIGCIASGYVYLCLTDGAQPTVLQYKTIRNISGKARVVSLPKLWDLIDDIQRKLKGKTKRLGGRKKF